MKHYLLKAAATVGVLLSNIAAASTIDFNSIAAGTSVPIVASLGPRTAVVGSPDGGVFSIFPSFFSSFSGNVLVDSDPESHILNILFDGNMESISFQFALNGEESASISLTALAGGLGGSQVGNASASGRILPNGLFPEGTLAFQGQRFDAIRIQSNARDFGVGNISGSPVTDTPEPSSVVCVLAGLILLGAAKRLQS